MGDPAPTRADWWSVLADRIGRIFALRGASPIAAAETEAGVSLRIESLVPPVQWVLLTSRISQGRYGFRHVRPLVDGTWEAYGDKYDNLYEVNADDALVGSYVEAYQSPVGDWRFQSLCCDCIAQVCVSVTDCCGGVEGASVIVSYTGPIDPSTGDPTIVISEECTTDSTGGCCVSVPTGYTYQVGVTATGYTSPGLDTADVTTCAQVLVEFTLECCEIDLDLTRCNGSEPVPNWPVSLVSLDDPPNLCAVPSLIQSTDVDGHAVWQVRPGEYEIQVAGWTATGDADACDGLYTEGPIVVEDCPGTAIPVSIAVECEANSCTGVEDSVHVTGCYGQPLSGVTVSLDWAGCDTYSGTTDSNGDFTFDASPCKSCPGTLTLTLSKSRFTTAVVTSSYDGFCGLYTYVGGLSPSSSYACGIPSCPDPLAKTLYLTVTHVGSAVFPPAGSFTLTWDATSTDWLSPCDGDNGRYRLDSATGLLAYETLTSGGCTGATLATYAFTNHSTTCPPSFSSTQRRYIPDLSNYAEGVITE